MKMEERGGGEEILGNLIYRDQYRRVILIQGEGWGSGRGGVLPCKLEKAEKNFIKGILKQVLSFLKT